MNTSTEMSEFIEESRELLNKMSKFHEKNELNNEFNQQQLNSYKEMVSDSIDLAERRWNNMRQLVFAIVAIFLATGFTGGVSLSKRPTTQEVRDKYATKEEMLRSFGVATENVYEVFEDTGVLTTDQACEQAKEARMDILQEIDPYISRSLKEIKDK